MQTLNPRSPQDAIAWARTLMTGKDTGLSGLCDHFVAESYGWNASGDACAMVTWNNATEKHKGDRNPPAGALVCWTYNGKAGYNYGHIALSSGNGKVISTDVGGKGVVSEVPLSWFEQHWGSFSYLGWIQPQFKAPARPVSKPKFPGIVK